MINSEITERYRKRVDELLNKLKVGQVNRAKIDGCFLGTLTIIQSLYGENSLQVKVLFEAKETSNAYHHILEKLNSLGGSINGTLINIREELDADLIRSISTEAAGLVIGDLVALAKEELKAGYSSVAAVLASAALEDALKRKAEELGGNVENKTLSSVINLLKSESFFKGAQGPIVSSFIKLRNAAMHADWDKIQDSDVSSLIGFLEPFLLKHFS
ncbi:MAG: hypothetical protein K8T10_00245 [Candidatus Eremiobacteraeota bacterium]|nr:hypothetical protein [Candidatus Eremiobacteraeota bacterium]